MNLTFDEMIERTLRPNVHTIFYSLKKVVSSPFTWDKGVLCETRPSGLQRGRVLCTI